MSDDRQVPNTPARTEGRKVVRGEEKAMAQGTPSAGGSLVRDESLTDNESLRGRAKGAAARQESK